MTQLGTPTQAAPGTAAPATGGSPAAPQAGPPPFSPAELQALRAEDRTAAVAIVGIMTGIFTLALLGYAFIAFWVAGGP
jgi:hypothetical protein